MFKIVGQRQERRTYNIKELHFLGSLLNRPIVTSPLLKPEPIPRPIETPSQTKLGGMVGSRLDIAEAAKLLRADLASTFPGSKFCVTVERYSMGETINVSWIDGPPSIAVDKVLNKYQEIDYDPGSHEILSGGNRFVQGSRRYSKPTYDHAQTAFAQNPAGFSTAWHMLSSSAYPEVAFKCERGHASPLGGVEIY